MLSKNDTSIVKKSEIELLSDWIKEELFDVEIINNILKLSHNNQVPPLWTAVSLNHFAIAQKILEQTNSNVNFKHFTGQTALWTAVYKGYIDLVNLLLNHDANSNEICNDCSPLYVAAYNGNFSIAATLIKAGCNLELASEDSNETPVFAAARCGHIEILNLLIAAGANINAKQHFGGTPLHIAVENNQLEAVKILIQAGAELNSLNNRDLSPLSIAHQYNYQDIANQLSLAEALPDLQQGWIEKQLCTYLTYMQILHPEKYNEFDVLNLIDSLDGLCNGISLLWAYKKKRGCEAQFINNLQYISQWDGAQKTLENNDILIKTIEQTLNDLIWLKGDHFLLKNTNQSHLSSLINTISHHDYNYEEGFKLGFVFKKEELVELFNQILLNDTVICIQHHGSNGGISHTIAMIKSNENKIILFDSEASLGEMSLFSVTELISKINSIYRPPNDINYKLPTDPNLPLGLVITALIAQDTDYKTTYEKIKTDTLSKIISNRIQNHELDLEDSTGVTSIACAAFADDQKLVEQLIRLGAQLNPKQGGVPPLFWTAQIGNNNLLCKLIDAAANVNCSYQNRTPLLVATSSKHAEVVKTLIKNKAIIDPIDSSVPSLFIACIQGSIDIVRILLEEGKAAINEIHKISGHSPLYTCSLVGHAEIVKYLLQKGAKNEAITTNDGTYSSFEIGILHGNLSVVNVFVEHGIDIKAQGPCGLSPLNLAKKISNTSIISYLENLLASTHSTSIIKNIEINHQPVPCKPYAFFQKETHVTDKNLNKTQNNALQ